MNGDCVFLFKSKERKKHGKVKFSESPEGNWQPTFPPKLNWFQLEETRQLFQISRINIAKILLAFKITDQFVKKKSEELVMFSGGTIISNLFRLKSIARNLFLSPLHLNEICGAASKIKKKTFRL